MFRETISTAFRALKSNRLRTALTMLGVVIGVAAVVAMLALGEGARVNVEGRIRSLGSNLLTVRPGTQRRGPVHSRIDSLTLDDVEALTSVPGIAAVAPESMTSVQVKYLAANMSCTIIGTTPAYLDIRAFELSRGATFSTRDLQGRKRVAIIGSSVASTLFHQLSPLGERIQIQGVSHRVIGVLKEKGDMGWFKPDEQILVPITTYQSVLSGAVYINSISIKVELEDAMDTVQGDVERLLRGRHRIAAGAEDDFNVQSQTEMLDTMNQVTNTFTALLGGVAAVSLLVGGIGIMNIMLVSVRERTREIGIRMAVGARRRDILLQFLIEAVVVSLVGGVAGIFFGYLVATLLSHFSGWDTVIPVYAIVLAVVTSVSIGVVFGVWPARQAATLDPVEALRYE
ncbi:MAG: ABC transporter permease [Deltaproteobacteria bacterium]|nr:ABC transporter permease [Deltaproteobacteria bacterium]